MSSPVIIPQPSENTNPTSQPRKIIYLGMDAHKDSIMIAILPEYTKAPERVDRILNDRAKLAKFLRREGANWWTPHLRWLRQLGSESPPMQPADRMVFREYLALLGYKLARREELDREIERLAELPTIKPAVSRLQSLRGIALHSARVLATEIVDWHRFERPSQLAAYLGLVPREDSTGSRERRGSTVKS